MFSAWDSGKLRSRGHKFYFEMWYFPEGRGCFANGVRVDSLAVLDEAVQRVRQEGRYLGRGRIHGYKGHEKDYEIESWKVDKVMVVSEVLRDERARAGMPKKVVKVFSKTKGRIREIGLRLRLPVEHIPQERARIPLAEVITEILNS